MIHKATVGLRPVMPYRPRAYGCEGWGMRIERQQQVDTTQMNVLKRTHEHDIERNIGPTPNVTILEKAHAKLVNTYTNN